MNDKPARVNARRDRTRPRWLAAAPAIDDDVGTATIGTDDLLARLADLTDRAPGLHDEEPQAVLVAGVALALRTLDGIDEAGVMFVSTERALIPTAPSGELAGRLDGSQAVLAEGPGVDALFGAQDPVPTVAETVDLRVGAGATERWPRFAAEAQRLGVGVSLSLPMVTGLGSAVRPRTSGTRRYVLNLYGRDPRAIGAVDLALARALAGHVALAIGAARRVACLTDALESRDVIGQAKGILMQRHGLDPAAAFARLVAASQHTNLKLRDVATWLVEDGESGASP